MPTMLRGLCPSAEAHVAFRSPGYKTPPSHRGSRIRFFPIESSRTEVNIQHELCAVLQAVAYTATGGRPGMRGRHSIRLCSWVRYMNRSTAGSQGRHQVCFLISSSTETSWQGVGPCDQSLTVLLPLSIQDQKSWGCAQDPRGSGAW